MSETARRFARPNLEWLHPHQIAARLSPGRWRKDGMHGAWALCPCHDDREPSLHITRKNNALLIHCFPCGPHGQGAILAALRENGIALFPPDDHASALKPKSAMSGGVKTLVANYVYRDADGNELYRKKRYEWHDRGKRVGKRKDFRWERLTANGRWVAGLDGAVAPLYRLDELSAKLEQTIHFAEGEKKAEAIAKLGLLATSLPSPKKLDGAIDLSVCRGRIVYYHADNDDPGRLKAALMIAALANIAEKVIIVRYEDCGDGGDVADWLERPDSTGAIPSLEDFLAHCEMFEDPEFDTAATVETEQTRKALGATARIHGPRRSANGASYINGIPEMSDEALALKYAELHSANLRYTNKWGKWHYYDGKHWRPEETLLAQDFARKLCRQFATSVQYGSEKIEVTKAKKSAAVLTLARADRQLAATVDQWDNDPWLFNTPDGTMDLRTRVMREHRQSDYITKMAAVAPGGGCPRWRQFLSEITGGDEEFISFLARIVGYDLSGDTTEHALFFLWGTGANGKSVFINTVAGILGNYHRVAPIETFTASNRDRHPTELAMLTGARLVTSIETEEGRRWAESRIKQLTGGDPIPARFMHQDFFEFTPMFKLMIAGNHKPGLRNVDEAIRRRLHLIPFTVTIPREQRDPDLTLKLREEWPGILQWALHGFAEWQQRGLAPPSIVTMATAEYLAAEDDLGTWMQEHCDRAGEDSLQKLYGSYKSWATRNGAPERNNKWLSAQLAARDFVVRRTKIGTIISGLSVKPDLSVGIPSWLG
jgi:putative DNA primase/helicase